MGKSKDTAAMPPKRTIDTRHYSGRVAARMRSLREKAGWSVAALTGKINEHLSDEDGLAVSTVHHWDNGGRTIPPDMYPILARVFGMKVPEFLPQK